MESKIGVYGYEKINGDLVEIKPVSFYHQLVIAEITSQIYAVHKREKVILSGPFKVYLDEENIFLPDIICFEKDKAEEIIEGDRIYRGVDWICEVLTFETAEKDLNYKVSKYLEYGCKEYWVVDPYSLEAEGHILTEDGKSYRILTQKFIQSAYLSQRIELGTILLPPF